MHATYSSLAIKDESEMRL